MAYTKQNWVNEVLNGEERYRITGPGTNLNDVTIALTTGVTQAGTPVTAERMNHIEDGIANNEVKDTGRIALPLAAGWRAISPSPAFRKVGRLVELSGITIPPSNVADGAIIGTLPAGYRPTLKRYFLTYAYPSWASVRVEPNGAIYYKSIPGSTPGNIVLDGVMFHIN